MPSNEVPDATQPHTPGAFQPLPSPFQASAQHPGDPQTSAEEPSEEMPSFRDGLVSPPQWTPKRGKTDAGIQGLHGHRSCCSLARGTCEQHTFAGRPRCVVHPHACRLSQSVGVVWLELRRLPCASPGPHGDYLICVGVREGPPQLPGMHLACCLAWSGQHACVPVAVVHM